jgi:hypothetical protein
LPAKDGSVEPGTAQALQAEAMPALDQSGFSSFGSF